MAKVTLFAVPFLSGVLAGFLGLGLWLFNTPMFRMLPALEWLSYNQLWLAIGVGSSLIVGVPLWIIALRKVTL